MLQVECMLKSRADNPVLSCQPESGVDDWRSKNFWFAVKGYKVLMAVIYLYYIELFLYVSIGAAQISSMGDLAIQLSASVRGLFSENNGCYDRLVDKVPSKY